MFGPGTPNKIRIYKHGPDANIWIGSKMGGAQNGIPKRFKGFDNHCHLAEVVPCNLSHRRGGAQPGELHGSHWLHRLGCHAGDAGGHRYSPSLTC